MEVIHPPRASLASQAQNALVEAIIVGELAPGSLHSVAKLAERLNVSRSPVREALISLADQGMVAFERNHGVRIQQTTAHDLEEIFSLRLILEVPATFRATGRMQPKDLDRLRDALGTVEQFTSAPTVRAHQELDASFHRVILDVAGNQRLAAVVDTLWAQQMMRGASTAGRTRDLSDIYADHAAVYERIAAGDARGAARAMRVHLATTGGLLLAQEAGGAEDADAIELPWADVYSELGAPGGS